MGRTISTRTLSRRSLLRGATCLGAMAALPAPFIAPARAAARSIKVSTFGGYFEQGFKNYVFPAFTKATGIAVESVPQSESVAFLLQLQQAQKAGALPMDLCCMSSVDLLRGRALSLWQNYDSSRASAWDKMPARYVNHTADGAVDGVGATGWYETFVISTDDIKVPPASWKSLWDPARRNAWGLQSSSNSGLFEIVAGTWFGGNAILDTKEGIDKVLAKIAELKPNTKLWWEEEGTMQTALENGDVIGGMYYNDVAHTMAKNGTAVRSVFPKEGGLIDYGSWALLAASPKRAEAMELVAFTATPETQEMLARHAQLVPLLDHSTLHLTPAEFDAVSSDTPPLVMAAAARLKFQPYMDQQFTKMLAG